MPIGQWPSWLGHAEEAIERQPFFVLAWTRERNLRLIGYAWPERGSTVTYVFHSYGRGHVRLARGPSLMELLREPEHVSLIAEVRGR
jgi:hypothetical protein